MAHGWSEGIPIAKIAIVIGKRALKCSVFSVYLISGGYNISNLHQPVVHIWYTLRCTILISEENDCNHNQTNYIPFSCRFGQFVASLSTFWLEMLERCATLTMCMEMI